jgi:hypothetical protein
VLDAEPALGPIQNKSKVPITGRSYILIHFRIYQIEDSHINEMIKFEIDTLLKKYHVKHLFTEIVFYIWLDINI